MTFRRLLRWACVSCCFPGSRFGAPPAAWVIRLKSASSRARSWAALPRGFVNLPFLISIAPIFSGSCSVCFSLSPCWGSQIFYHNSDGLQLHFPLNM